MLKSGGAVIPMQLTAGKVECLCPSEPDYGVMPSLRALSPFSDEALSFLNALSQTLMADKEAKSYPDVVTLGFFCRRGNIERLKETYKDQITYRLGRGVTF